MNVDRNLLFTARSCLLFLVLLLFVGGCATKPKLLEPRVYVENYTGRSIQKIVYRECGKATDEWLPLKNWASLSSQYVVYIDLPMECADLQALFLDGKIAGTQQNINKKFPFKWTLR
jgi:hypothetical protein